MIEKYKRINVVGLGLTGSNLLSVILNNFKFEEIHLYDPDIVTMNNVDMHDGCITVKPLFQNRHNGKYKTTICKEYLTALSKREKIKIRIKEHTDFVRYPISDSDGVNNIMTVDCRDDFSSDIHADIRISLEGDSVLFDDRKLRHLVSNRDYMGDQDRSEYLDRFKIVAKKHFNLKAFGKHNKLIYYNLSSDSYLSRIRIINTGNIITSDRRYHIFSVKDINCLTTMTFDNGIIIRNRFNDKHIKCETFSELSAHIVEACHEFNPNKSIITYNYFLIDYNLINGFINVSIKLYPNVA